MQSDLTVEQAVEVTSQLMSLVNTSISLGVGQTLDNLEAVATVLATTASVTNTTDGMSLEPAVS